MGRASLKEYRRKRDFDRTPEPAGRKPKSTSGHLYIIQKHAARRLHYDFRIELDGTLKSWAVPKGPSLVPGDKRLAVHVEDHPIEYGSFEGVIPEGEYGGGTVMLWDRGTWEPLDDDPEKGYRKGRLSFNLQGEKLRGKWSLVRMARRSGDGADNWLLIKSRDDEAREPDDPEITDEEPLSVESGRSMEEIAEARDRVWSSTEGEVEAGDSPRRKTGAPTKSGKGNKKEPRNGVRAAGSAKSIDAATLPRAKKAAFPRTFSPQLATLVKDAPAGEDWVHEIKLDGYRMLCMIDGGKVRLITRRGKDWTDRFRPVADAVAHLPADSAVIDGEVVALDSAGISSFQSLQNAMRGGRKQPALHFYAFDLPYCNGYDLTRSPLLERKALLERIVAGAGDDADTIRFSEHIVGKGGDVFQHACRLALEGIISKRADARYENGRSRTWLKVKCLRRQEFVVGGYTDPGGARTGFGALLLGYHDNGDLVFCGKVGTGFTDETLRTLSKELSKRERKTPPFANPPSGADARNVHWVTPELVAEVEFTEWTNEGILRHPSFQGLREDKEPSEITREEPQSMTEVRGQATRTGRSATKRTTKRRTTNTKRTGRETRATESANRQSTVGGVALSNPDRILYPDQGITKQQLASFYEQIADWILPHIVKRPLTLIRCPRGREKECFYQKHFNESVPAPVRGIRIREKDGDATYLAIDDLAGLITLVQIGVLEFHPWGSREDDIERPDRLVFDLDPDPAVSWADIIEAARDVRDMLEELGLKSFPRTSGGKGLHLVVPIARRTDPRSAWDEAKAFTKAVAEEIARRDSSRYIATMSKAKRKGKVFIDYLRNGRGATSIASYSTRARKGAPVATPIRWDELSEAIGPAHFTVSNLPRRLASLKSDPWQGFFDTRQSITAKAKKAVGM